jgi:hypothetical protein
MIAPFAGDPGEAFLSDKRDFILGSRKCRLPFVLSSGIVKKEGKGRSECRKNPEKEKKGDRRGP